MKWIYLAILAPLFLAGCNGEKDTDYYRKHHDELITEYTDCLLHDQFHSPTNTKCSYVRDAANYEKDSPDIREGLKNALAEKLKTVGKEPIPDFNNLKKN